MQGFELFAQGFQNAAIAVPDRNDIDAGQGVEVAFAGHVPIIDALRPGHDERLLRPLGHLVADEDVPEELLLRGLGGGDQVGECDGGHSFNSDLSFRGRKRRQIQDPANC